MRFTKEDRDKLSFVTTLFFICAMTTFHKCNDKDMFKRLVLAKGCNFITVNAKETKLKVKDKLESEEEKSKKSKRDKSEDKSNENLKVRGDSDTRNNKISLLSRFISALFRLILRKDITLLEGETFGHHLHRNQLFCPGVI